MGLPFIIISGLVIGWLAAVLRRVENGREICHQLVAGLAGALCGGLVIAPLLGAENLLAGTYSIPALLLTLVGAAVAAALLNILRPVQADDRTGPGT